MKVLNSTQLRRINMSSVREDRHCILSPGFMASLDPNGVHVISDKGTFKRTHDIMRCLLLVKVKNNVEPVPCVLDMSVKDYGTLVDHSDYVKSERS